MEYGHEHAVTDNVNVPYDVYKIDTEITAAGARVEKGFYVDKRDRLTRKVRWEQLDEDLSYAPNELDRAVVAPDQIRTVIRTFRDRLFTDIFPGRTVVPKTLIFAKDDSHADDIVKIVREEFGKGNDFCQKITYKVTGAKPADLIQSFRNSYSPRIVVTVDLIATGTDIKPVEIVMFMRSVHSRVLFEQMKGRGVRVINPDELRAVTPDAKGKTHFLIVDCVDVTEKTLSDTKPLEKNPSVSLKVLLDHVAAGGGKDDYLSSLASPPARIDKQCGPEDKKLIGDTSGGVSLGSISGALVTALDADEQDAAARRMFGLSVTDTPTAEQIAKAAAPLKKAAIQALMAAPPLRKLILDLRQKFEQIVDEVSKDTLLPEQTGYSLEARQKPIDTVYFAEGGPSTDLRFFYYLLRFRDLRSLDRSTAVPGLSRDD